ncbi:low specificity L-threonine aldolase [Devosia sp. ZB163]|uniref:threonine aldolase family protein n=1 Tax=Devosia sp. ZB163 TaxID=3025938 RepID=UPI002361A10C|nr:low specificity L-threonine aldolase [Devosia sp. ZB163]MDC9823414.1 low specificity L-threonine aldolase [Devosia sp. ZB163]
MNFASDNWAGATPEVMAALVKANDGAAPAYGSDALTRRVTGLFSEVFEKEVEVWFTATGTGSNSLGLAALSRPGGLVLCSSEAHIHSDEWGATEFQSGGMKLVTMPQVAGRVSAEALRQTLSRFPEGNRFGVPVALSLTNATECGTVYAPAAVAELAGLARAQGLAVHMDGARFGNAVAATGAKPAELTWKSGVDFLSFGGTKNGCWAAEAIVVFSPDKLSDLAARRQRAGHTFSKSRFVAAQFEAYLTGGNWLRWAGQANARAEQLRVGLRASSQARLGWGSEANEVFAVLPRETIARIRLAGGTLYEWPAEGMGLTADEDLVRLVTSWATSPDEVARFLAMVG